MFVTQSPYVLSGPLHFRKVLKIGEVGILQKVRFAENTFGFRAISETSNDFLRINNVLKVKRNPENKRIKIKDEKEMEKIKGINRNTNLANVSELIY